MDSPRRACFRFFNEWFLKGHHQPSSCQRPAQFMPEVQEELTKAWRAPYSACMNPSTAAALTTVDGAEKKRYCKLSPHVTLDAGPQKHPDLHAVRKRRGLILTDARIPSKIARSHSPPLRMPLSGGGVLTRHVLSFQCVPQTTAVIADPHTIKSKFPLPTLTHVSSPPAGNEQSLLKAKTLTKTSSMHGELPSMEMFTNVISPPAGGDLP